MYSEGENAFYKAQLLENNLKQQFHVLQRQQAQLKESERKIAMVIIL